MVNSRIVRERTTQWKIVVWEKGDALVAPAGAVSRRGVGFAVYVVEGGVARLRDVQTGNRNEAEIEFLSGLELGAKLVLYPSDRIVDGVKVTVR